MTGNLLAQVEVAGQRIDYRQEPRCLTCRSGHRQSVEAMIAMGRTWRGIARALPADAGLSEDNIRQHYSRGHMPLQAAVVQQAAEDRRLEISAAAEGQVEQRARHTRLAHAVLDRVLFRLASGDIEPEVRDGMAAARFLATLEPSEAGQGEYVAAFESLILAARSVLPAGQFDLVNQEFRKRTARASLAGGSAG